MENNELRPLRPRLLSTVVCGDQVFVTTAVSRAGTDARSLTTMEFQLLCFDRKTGKTIWKTDRDEPSCWATPLVVEHAGRKQVVMNGQ